MLENIHSIKLFVLVCLLSWLGSSSYAQSKHSFGFKGGYHLVDQSFRFQFTRNTALNTNFYGGLHGELFYRNILDKHVGLQLSIGRYEKGWVQDFERDSISNFRQTITYNRFFFGSFFYTDLFKGRARIIMNLGPYVELRSGDKNNLFDDLKNKERIDQLLVDQPQVAFLTYNKEEHEKIGHGIHAELGFSIETKSSSFQATAVAGASTSHIIRPETFDQDDPTPQPSQANHFYFGGSFGVLYKFGTSKPKQDAKANTKKIKP